MATLIGCFKFLQKVRRLIGALILLGGVLQLLRLNYTGNAFVFAIPFITIIFGFIVVVKKNKKENKPTQQIIQKSDSKYLRDYREEISHWKNKYFESEDRGVGKTVATVVLSLILVGVLIWAIIVQSQYDKLTNGLKNRISQCSGECYWYSAECVDLDSYEGDFRESRINKLVLANNDVDALLKIKNSLDNSMNYYSCDVTRLNK